MAKRMQYSVVGLPHYTVWHLYEPSVDDIRHMEEMEQERRNRENEERERAERANKIKEEFGDPGNQWDKDKSVMTEISAKDDQIRKEHDAAMAAQEKEKSIDSVAGKDAAIDKKVEVGDEDVKITKDTKLAKDSTGSKEGKQEKDASRPKDTKDWEVKVERRKGEDEKP